MMKERRRRQAKRRFLPEPTGENLIPMTKSCRRILNTWKKGRGRLANLANKVSKLNRLLIKGER